MSPKICRPSGIRTTSLATPRQGGCRVVSLPLVRMFPRQGGSFSLTDHAVSGFSGSASGTWTLCLIDTDAFGQAVTEHGEPVLVVATAFALVHLLDHLGGGTLPLPPSLVEPHQAVSAKLGPSVAKQATTRRPPLLRPACGQSDKPCSVTAR